MMNEDQKPMEPDKSTKRSIRGLLAKMLKPIIAATALFFVYTGWSGPGEAMIQQGILVGVCLLATFILYPLGSKTSIWLFVIDSAISALSVLTVAYIVWLQPKMFLIKMEPSQFDLIACGILIVLVLEATRRVSGWAVLG